MRFLGTILVFSMAASADCIRVDGEFIRVADVPHAAASGLASDEVLLRAPAAGVRRTVDGAEMRRLLRLPESAPAIPSVCFELVTESLSPERILEAMRKNFPGRDLSIRVSDFSRYPVPKGRLEFTRAGLFATSATVPGHVVLWRGKIVDAGGRSTPVWARIVIETTREVLTCRRTLEPGARIGPADLVQVPKAAHPFEQHAQNGARPRHDADACSFGIGGAERALCAFEEHAQNGARPRHDATTCSFGIGGAERALCASKETTLLQPTDVIGMAAKRRIPAGTEITRQMLMEPFEIEARQTVTLEVRADLVRLKMSAIAEGRGRTGDSIWLKQTITGKRLRGRVTGPGTAIVEINPISGEKTKNDLVEVPSSTEPATGRPQP